MAAKRYLDRKLKLQHFRAIEAIDAQRSLLKASAVLGLSQPALSKTLQELELIFQQRLFDRLPRGMRPTEAGSLLAKGSRRILADIRRLEDELDRIGSPGGSSVALGTLPVAATGVLPGALIRLKAQHPNLRVRLDQGRTEELLPKLASGEIDLIVGRLYEPVVPDGFIREALWEEPISLLARAAHPLCLKPQITVEDLKDYELVLPTVTQRVGQEIEAVLTQMNLAPTASLRSSSYGFIREMLLDTDMISAMPRLMMAGELLRGTFRVIPLPVRAPRRPAGVILPGKGILRPGGAAFLQALRDYVAEIGQRGLTAVAPARGEAGPAAAAGRARTVGRGRAG